MTTILAFTADQVHRLTGLSHRQIQYWSTTKFYNPSYSDDRGRPYGRVYSFQDLVHLRVIAILNRVHKVKLPRLRVVKQWLDSHPYDSWSTLKFYLSGNELIFEDRELNVFLASAKPGQTVMAIELQDIIRSARADADEMRRRTPDEIGTIVQHRYISHNKPVLAGTRIRVEAVWHFHEAGYTTDEIIAEYPRLAPGDVSAAIAFMEDRQRGLAS